MSGNDGLRQVEEDGDSCLFAVDEDHGRSVEKKESVQSIMRLFEKRAFSYRKAIEPQAIHL